jgi:hypothetical protein
MDDHGKRQEQDEALEQRIYQMLALLERAGEQQRAAVEMLARAAELEQRIAQVIDNAGQAAAARMAEETRSALDGAIAESAATLRQAARSAVAAAENLRLPWWLHLGAILAAGVLAAGVAVWATHRADTAAAQQDQRTQQQLHEGQLLEHVWPRLTPAQRKKLEQLDAQ